MSVDKVVYGGGGVKSSYRKGVIIKMGKVIYQSPFSCDSNDIKKFQKNSSVEKNRLEILERSSNVFF